MEYLLMGSIILLLMIMFAFALFKGLSNIEKTEDEIECIKVPIISVNADVNRSIDKYFAKYPFKTKTIYINDELVLKRTGFEKCEWNPDPSDKCEKCGTENVQMYFCRTNYWENEGIYWCINCIRELDKQNIIDANFKQVII